MLLNQTQTKKQQIPLGGIEFSCSSSISCTQHLPTASIIVSFQNIILGVQTSRITSIVLSAESCVLRSGSIRGLGISGWVSCGIRAWGGYWINNCTCKADEDQKINQPSKSAPSQYPELLEAVGEYRKLPIQLLVYLQHRAIFLI